MHWVALPVAVAAYGVSIAISPRLPTGRRVVPSGALGPALVALGPAGYAVAPMWAILLLACLVHGGAVTLLKRRLQVADPLRHLTLLVLSAEIFDWVGSAFADGHLPSAGAPLFLAAVALSSLPFPIGDALARAGSRARRYRAPFLPLVREEIRSAALLHLVFLSTAGLVTLSFADLGPVAFTILLLPLFAAHLGFSRYAAARRTYEQTVRALGTLTETAGYAREGHHERVAQLAVALARELGLWGDRVRMLELVALLHDVGAVSVPDPEDLVHVDPTFVARAGRRVLEETGYLAGQANLLSALAAEPREAASLDARILRIASAYDDLATSTLDPIERLEREAALEDRRVLDALRKVLDRRAVEDLQRATR